MGCFGQRPPRNDDVELPAKEQLAADDPLALAGWVECHQNGEWQRRWALITGSGILVVYKEPNLGKTYKLVNLKDLKMRKTAKGVEMKLMTCANRKAKIRIKGEEASHWAARMCQPSGKKLGHRSHVGQLPPKISRSESDDDSCVSYSIELSRSGDSIPRLLDERNGAGKVHSILTDTSMSTSEKKEKLWTLAGSTREQRAKSVDDGWSGNYDSDDEEPSMKQFF